jgi:hypothetical protein
MATERKVMLPFEPQDLAARVYLDLRALKGDLTAAAAAQPHLLGGAVASALERVSDWEEREWVEVGVRSVRTFQHLGRVAGLGEEAIGESGATFATLGMRVLQVVARGEWAVWLSVCLCLWPPWPAGLAAVTTQAGGADDRVPADCTNAAGLESFLERATPADFASGGGFATEGIDTEHGRTSLGWTALHWAASSNPKAHAVKALLEVRAAAQPPASSTASSTAARYWPRPVVHAVW